MNKPIVFGTDGWRAIIADEYTFDNVRRCARAVAELMSGKAWPIAASSSATTCGSNRKTSPRPRPRRSPVPAFGRYLCARSEPTPVISHAVLNRESRGRDHDHREPQPRPVQRIQGAFGLRWSGRARNDCRARSDHCRDASRQASLSSPARSCRARRLVDGDPASRRLRRAGCSAGRPGGHSQSRLRVVVNAMYGAGMGWFPRMLGGGASRLSKSTPSAIRFFPGINPEPIARNLAEALPNRTDDVRPALGWRPMATPTDWACATNTASSSTSSRLQPSRALPTGSPQVCGSNREDALDQLRCSIGLAEIYSVPVYETGVSFKYIAPKMIETDALIGGEESGGYAFRGHIPRARRNTGWICSSWIYMVKLRQDAVRAGRLPVRERSVRTTTIELDVQFPAETAGRDSARLSECSVERNISGVPSRSSYHSGRLFKFMLTRWQLAADPIQRHRTDNANLRRGRGALDQIKSISTRENGFAGV